MDETNKILLELLEEIKEMNATLSRELREVKVRLNEFLSK